MYRWTVCDPLKEDIIDKGEIDRDEILETFHTFPWEEMMQKQINAADGDIYYSPSLEFENTTNKNSIVISAIPNSNDLQKDGYVFYIFYRENTDAPSFEKIDQTFEDAEKFLKLFQREHYKDLVNKFDQQGKKRKKDIPENYITLFGSEHAPVIILIGFLVFFFIILTLSGHRWD